MDNHSSLRQKKSMSNRTRRVIYKTEGKVLKQLREQHGLSMKELGAKLGLSDSSISQWENMRSDLTPNNIKKICKIFEIGEKYFFELCREYDNNSTDYDYIGDNYKKLDETSAKMVRTFMQTLLEKK